MLTFLESATAFGAVRTRSVALYPPITTFRESLIADVGSFTFVR